MISLFMFVSGYQVIGKVLSEDEQTFIVDMPLTLSFSTASASTAIHTNKLMPLAKHTHVIVNKSTIMAMAEVDDEIAKYYDKMVQKLEKRKPSFVPDYEEKEITKEDIDSLIDMIEMSSKTIH